MKIITRTTAEPMSKNTDNKYTTRSQNYSRTQYSYKRLRIRGNLLMDNHPMSHSVTRNSIWAVAAYCFSGVHFSVIDPRSRQMKDMGSRK